LNVVRAVNFNATVTTWTAINFF